jgi:hypothetical protein
MMHLRSFDDALDASLDAIGRGEEIEGVLAAHPRHAAKLRPLLDATLVARAVGAPEPKRLYANFAAVRSAIRDARVIREIKPARQPASLRIGGERRLSFASLYAFILIASVSSVAGASVPIDAGDVVPSFVQNLVLSGPAESPTADVAPSAPAPMAAATDSTAADSVPSMSITLNGQAGDLSLSGFTLVSGENSWTVSLDGATAITGELRDGATVTLVGYATGATGIHAQSLVVAGSVATGGESSTAPSPVNPVVPADPAAPVEAAPIATAPAASVTPEAGSPPPTPPASAPGNSGSNRHNNND